MISTKNVLSLLIFLGLLCSLGIYLITDSIYRASERYYRLSDQATELIEYSVQLNVLAADYNLTSSKRALAQAGVLMDRMEYSAATTEAVSDAIAYPVAYLREEIERTRVIIDRLSRSTTDTTLKWEILALTNQSSELFVKIKNFHNQVVELNREEMQLYLTLRVVLILFLVTTFFSVAYTFYSMLVKPFKSIQTQLVQLRDGNLDVEFEKPKIKEWSVIVGELNKAKHNLAEILVSKFELEKEIERRKQIQEKFRLVSVTDHMTGLPNRRSFMDHIKQAIENAHQQRDKFYLLYVDLDNIKGINDNLGHTIGDEVICNVARILNHNSSKLAHVSRIGGDEFAILVNQASHQKIEYLAKTLSVLISTPMFIEGVKVRVGLSIGVAQYPADAQTPAGLIACADYAMYYAKKHPLVSDNITFYEPSHATANKSKFDLINMIKEAVEHQDFEVWYQPQVSSVTRVISGFEALLRWKNKQGQWISPNEFIPLLEQSSDIINVGRFVIEQAIAMRKLLVKHGVDIPVSVNISASQLEQENFVDMLTHIFEHNQESFSTIPLELTETAIFLDKNNIIHQLSVLQSMGFKLHLDDFGTGNASLDLLKNFDFDAVKIDKSFTDTLITDSKSMALVDAMSLLARRMNFSLIIEGVEIEQHVIISQEKRIAHLQGYYFSKAMPQGEALNWAISSKGVVKEEYSS